MPKNSLNVSLKGADDIFSTEESRQEQQREQVQQIPIGELFPFKNHPFKVLDDESMQRTVESVEQYGVLSPLIARPRPEVAMRSSPGTAVSTLHSLPGWMPCLLSSVRWMMMPPFCSWWTAISNVRTFCPVKGLSPTK